MHFVKNKKTTKITLDKNSLASPSVASKSEKFRTISISALGGNSTSFHDIPLGYKEVISNVSYM
jgi:hypothetical protein